ncbi:hypothetical protein MPDQ_007115 [Monascus purpureus]|uniref:Uncharacterized protein n=1 Tax=Monascus purpureus TaxID=5098 RepID=A0A507R5E3_MONPU|nr:hypothetical protein MPDQ_007115 [Monascus purpureus]
MGDLRRAAREHLKRPDLDANPEFDPTDIAIPGGLDLLRQELSSKGNTNHLETCENLLVVQGYLKAWGSRSLSEDDKNAANDLYDWAAAIALPSSLFAESESLSGLLPIQRAFNAPDIIVALASFTSEKDAWVTKESFAKSTTVLQAYITERRLENDPSLWSMIEYILKNRIKPLFSKTRNPAITAAGRKNFHPIPLPRFDMSVLDPETKPWKVSDVYATTVFSWIIMQYLPTDRDHLEAHFPLLVPPILALIDDESLPFKAHGCSLLSQFLIPIRESGSDILRRSNLSSVFEEAVTPCLLSLPTITPEDDSLQLLGVAYPALLSLLKTSYGYPSYKLPHPSSRHQQLSKDKQKYTDSVTKVLRFNLIPSFHHISSTNPASVSSFASFPFPRLSAFLVEQITIAVNELQIHTTKYLQELIPLLYSTLSSPFGTAYPLLLLAATTATCAVILNAHPRVWRWRGELLGGACSCWLQVSEEEKRIAEQAARGEEAQPDRSGSQGLVKLRMQLRSLVYLLKFTLLNPIPVQGQLDAGQLDAKEKIQKELQELVHADDDLRDLLFFEIGPDDANKFF